MLSFATRFDLGGDAPWYLLSLVAVGYVPWMAVLLGLVWLAIAAQLATLVSGRYAAFPDVRVARSPQRVRPGRSRPAATRRRRSATRWKADEKAPRILGTLMIIAGVGALAWAFTVWKWEDPFTATLNYYDQRQLAKSFDRQLEEGRPAGTATTPVDVRKTLPRSAVKWRRSLKRGGRGRPAADPAARPERGDRQRHRHQLAQARPGPLPRSRGCRARESSSTSPGTGRPTARRSPGSTSCARETASSWSSRTGRSSTRSPATGSSSRRKPPCSSRRATSSSRSRPATPASSRRTATSPTRSRWPCHRRA